MNVILMCYAHPGRYLAEHIYSLQQATAKTALEVGNIDLVIPFRNEHINWQFSMDNAGLLSAPRGAGYWLWKPYFALKMLDSPEIGTNDIIIYCDSKILFEKPVKPLIDVFLRDNLSVMTFRQLASSKVFTKRDAFILTESDEPKYVETTQRVGGFWIFKKDDFSRHFFETMLKYHKDYRIISDSPSQCGINEYSQFKEHRHCESLISILAKRFDLYPYKFPYIKYIPKEQEMTGGQFTDESYRRWQNTNPNDWSVTTFKQYPDIITDTRSTYDGIINY